MGNRGRVFYTWIHVKAPPPPLSKQAQNVNTVSTQHYTCRHITPESHDFRRFLRPFWTDFLEIMQR